MMKKTKKIILLFLLMFFVIGFNLTYASRIPLDKSLVEFSRDTLGGIRTIVRYEIPTPDRTDIAVLFLSDPMRAGALPMRIQILNEENVEQQQLIESEGADCILNRVALFKAGKEVAAVVATRVFTTASFTQAEPGPMKIQVYQLLQSDGDPGSSNIVFKAKGAEIFSKPICLVNDVDEAIDAVAITWRPNAIQP